MTTDSPRPGRQAITTAGAPAPIGGYSQGIAAGPYLFTSGFGPQDPVTGELGETIDEQTHQVLANLSALLATDGLTLEDVVKATVHLQDVHRDFAGFDQVYRKHFSDRGRCARRSAPS